MKARAPVLRVLAMVLAGGEGKRLAPLMADRAKPAVPFGGDGKTGVLVPFDSGGDQFGSPRHPKRFARDLAQAINGLLANPTRARSFGRAGRRRVLEQFSWSAIATRTAALYESLPSTRLQAQPGTAGLSTARTASKRRPLASRRRASR